MSGRSESLEINQLLGFGASSPEDRRKSLRRRIEEFSEKQGKIYDLYDELVSSDSRIFLRWPEDERNLVLEILRFVYDLSVLKTMARYDEILAGNTKEDVQRFLDL